MTETYDGIKGYFSIFLKNNKGEIVDSYEEQNLIVDIARQNLAKLIGGYTSGVPINKFVIGTDGWINDVRTPKTIVDGLNKDMIELFSETNDKYFYEINFEGTGSQDGIRNVTSETDYPQDEQTVSTVSVIQNERKLVYTIVIPTNAANNLGQGSDFTEAGFYCGETLFNIKTFPIKLKDDSTELTIIWTLEF